MLIDSPYLDFTSDICTSCAAATPYLNEVFGSCVTAAECENNYGH